MPDGVHFPDETDVRLGVGTGGESFRRHAPALTGIDAAAIGEFLEEWADDMLSAVRSHLVNLMAHAAKASFSRNPDVVGHWRSECTEFHDRLIDAYRPSMHDKIDVERLWRRACRKVVSSFADHGEADPALPSQCPDSLDRLVDPDLNIGGLIGVPPDRQVATPKRRRLKAPLATRE